VFPRMRMRRAVLAGGAAALIVAGTALGGNLGQRFSKGSNVGTNVVAHARGTVKKPTAIFAKVTSRPRQKVVGVYADDCIKGGGGGTKGGQFSGKTPVVVKLKHRFSVPDACLVNANALLKGKGHITVALYARTAG
jgi:hypothetical protein